MRFLSLLCFILSLVGQAGFAQPVVTTSIRPLQLIAGAITDGNPGPLLVLGGGQDPHHPSLRPSQRRAIAEADVFLWVGPALETGMERMVKELGAAVITAMDLPGVTVHDIAGQPDPHIWLDTRNAVAIAAALSRELSRLDPGNAPRYADNLAAFRAAMETLDDDVRRILDPGNFPPYVVYHDGYRYFEAQFGLAHLASFTANEELQPGIRRVMALRTVMGEGNVNCVVVNPSVNTRNLDNQLGRDGLRFVVIDMLATDAVPGRQAYRRWMLSVANALSTCRQ